VFLPRNEDINEILNSTESELNKLKGSTVFLAGAAGFLGRYFLNCFSEFNKNNVEKIKVIGVDNFISSGKFGNTVREKSYDNVYFKSLDLTDLNNKDFNEICDASHVIHAAGIASPKHYKENPLATIDVAVQGSRKMLEICKDTGARYTFFSSSEIYGNPPNEEIPIKESFKGLVSSTGPRSCYDESKRLGETLCSVYGSEFNVHTNIIRPFNVYGPGMQSTDYRVMPNFAFRLKNNEPLEVYGTGNQTRTYCYVTDAISGFLKVFCIGRFGEAYNIGNPNEEISAFDLAKRFKALTASNSCINVIDHPTDYPADEPDRRCPSINKAEEHLNYSPAINLETGISRFAEYIEIPVK
jgi:UDP-glucuronate decarboxylase